MNCCFHFTSPNTLGLVYLLINGTNPFMKSIAYITPSGNPPNNLITTIINEIPPPYIHIPFPVSGEVTQSVAI